MLVFSIGISALLVAAAPAAAEPSTASEKKICKRVQSTGWRLSNSSRVCKTSAEWKALAKEMQDRAAEFGRSGSRGDLAVGEMGSANERWGGSPR